MHTSVTVMNSANRYLKSTPRPLDDLRQFQHYAADFIHDNLNCALWVDMGLGKTVCVLTGLVDLIYEFEIDKVLVIAPLRVARKTWRDEIDTWGHTQDLTISHIIGTPQERLEGIVADADIYCINRENLTWLVDLHIEERKQIRRWKWDTVVLDESSSFKSGGKNGSKRWLALAKVRRLFTRCIQLTGTPSPNGLMDIWAQIYLLDQGERLGHTLTAFRDRWFNPPGYNQHKWKIKDGAEQEILALISDLCLTLREEDWLELPEVVYNFIPVSLSPAERRQYNRFRRTYILELKGQKITAVNAGVLAGKLLQLANGAVYTDNPEWVAFHDGKIEALLELVEFLSLDGPIMVCYNYRSDLVRIKAALTRAKYKFDVLTDEASEDRWNAGKTDILILHPASAGHGCNLHHSGSEHVIWFGLTYNLEFYLQANARVAGGHRRAGKSIVIHHIVTEGTLDDDVVASIEAKDDLQERLLNSMRKIVLKYAA